MPGRGRALLIAALGVFAAGCEPSVRWYYWWPEGGYTEAQAGGKLTLVYFRNWYRVECTEFARHVLSQKTVVNATADMVCVQLEYDVPTDRKLAASWGIVDVPGVAILGPDGLLLESAVGKITAEQLLETIARAKTEIAPATQPVATP